MRVFAEWARSVVVALIFLVMAATTSMGCPNCKEAVSASPSEAASLADGFNWSVLFMLSVPFSLVGTGALMVRRAVKNGAFPEL
jgi:hypothetical protein